MSTPAHVPPPPLVRRAPPNAVALETTVLVHGVPRASAMDLARSLAESARAAGALAAYVGVVRGVPTVGMTEGELAEFFAQASIPKANTSNLGWFIHQRQHAATTVSTTMEIASAAGIAVCATGGLGGVHKGLAERLDISADLGALARFPVALVTSGCKSILDVESTRELLETLGVPVVGYRTDRFPAFYRRESSAGVDARIDDVRTLAQFARQELARSGRGVVIANPIPAADELPEGEWKAWLAQAEEGARSAGATGRGVTPAILGRLHEASEHATVRANMALIRSNVALAAEMASRWFGSD